MNRLTRELREVCRKHVLEEKWLLAPSLRVGFQWVDRIARTGQPVLNLRVKTLLHTALELASPEMDRRGLSLLRGVRAEVLADRIFRRLKGFGDGYLTALEPSTGLLRTMQSAIRDLRLARLDSVRLQANAFEVEAKGREIQVLMEEYEKAVEAGSWVDYAGVLRMAASRLQEGPHALPAGGFVILPEELEKDLLALERDFWESVPGTNRILLQEDRPGEDPGGDLTDTILLRWSSRPAEAPAPREDGTVEIYRAVGEVNEVREVLRRCMEKKIPLDEVEILHTDAATYVPLIYERAWSLKSEDDDSIPVTFSEGIPPRYSRPARALVAWLSWIREDYPQSFLVRMIRDGLLRIERGGEEERSFARMADRLRTLPVGNGKDRTVAVLEKEIAALETRIQKERRGPMAPQPGGNDNEKKSPYESGQTRLRERIHDLKAVLVCVRELLACAPTGASDPRAWVDGALIFLERHVRRVNQFDEYCQAQLEKEIRELAECLEEEPLAGLDAWQWIANLTQASHVGGLGPMPGCLYVEPLYRGGHSGRRHTFIVGLDDTRFPGAGLQDPLLLDAERRQISPDMPTASGRLAGKMEAFSRLMARLRGNVTLGYCCRSLIDEREMFPSSVVLSVFRIVSGKREGDQKDLLDWLPDPVSFAPAASNRCADLTEWWIWRLCAGQRVKEPETVVSRNFPHLGRGLEARRERESDRYTAYDGHVPAAGSDLDPAKPDGTVLSANRLETLGACPMEYFFRYVLEIEPLEAYEIDPGVWLDAAQKGQLLHEVFRRFMSRLQQGGRFPAFDADLEVLTRILEEEIRAWEARIPAPNQDVFQREMRELRQTARIFLLEEETFCRQSTPFCFEAAIGLPSEGGVTPLDTSEPVEVELSQGEVVRARGRVDRVDRLPGEHDHRFSVWDYKTGSSWKYRKDRSRPGENPFDGGRIVQSALYLALVEKQLKQKISSRATVSLFGYFFPNLRERGERIQWSEAQLDQGKEVLGRLCEMIGKGCFPFTDNAEDVRFSDYLDAFGDEMDNARAVASKLDNRENKVLQPFQELRGYSKDDPIE